MLIAYIAGTYGFGFAGMATFLLPLRAKELGAPLPLIGLIVGAGGLIPALISVPAGELSDRIGAHRTYYLATLISGFAAAGFALMTSYWGLLVLQFVFGTARSIGWVSSQTYVTAIGAPSDRPKITGRFSFAVSLGTLGGPVIIGVVAQIIGYQHAFWFMAAVAIIYTAMGLALPNVQSGARAAAARGAAGFGVALDLLRRKQIQVALILTLARIWNGAGWTPFYQLLLQEHGYGPALIGIVVAGGPVVGAAVSLASGRIARLASKETLTIVGLAVGAGGILLSPHVAFMPLVFLPPALIGIGTGVSLPMLMSIMGDAAPPGRLGVALGLRTGANQAASLLSPIVVGSLFPAVGLVLGFAFSAMISWSLIGAAAWRYAGRRRVLRPPVVVDIDH
jgi:MFS family permease